MFHITSSVLSVGALSVSFLLRDVIFNAREHDAWNKSAMVCLLYKD